MCSATASASGGDIYRIDFRFREGIGAGDGDAAATGAHIKDVLRLMVNQSGKLVIDQFANRERGTSTRSST